MTATAPTELLKLAELAVSNGEVAAQLEIKDATLRASLVLNFHAALRVQAASVERAEVAGEAVAWRYRAKDQAEHRAWAYTHRRRPKEMDGWEVEDLYASPPRSEGVRASEAKLCPSCGEMLDAAGSCEHCDAAAASVNRSEVQTTGLPEIPDDDADFSPDLARKIISTYQQIIYDLTDGITGTLQKDEMERLRNAAQPPARCPRCNCHHKDEHLWKNCTLAGCVWRGVAQAPSKQETFCHWLKGYLGAIKERDELDAREANIIRNKLNEMLDGTPPEPSPDYFEVAGKMGAALVQIADMDPKECRADDLGRAARIAREALAPSVPSAECK